MFQQIGWCSFDKKIDDNLFSLVPCIDFLQDQIVNQIVPGSNKLFAKCPLIHEAAVVSLEALKRVMLY